MKKTPTLTKLRTRQSVAQMTHPVGLKSIFQQSMHEQWKTDETLCGQGSTMVHTVKMRKHLPEIIETYNIRSMLDIGCGDWNWMRYVPIECQYTGIELIDELYAQAVQHTAQNRTFLNVDVFEHDLPKVDLVLCRDVLVHLPLAMCVDLIKRLKTKYLLATTFPHENVNPEIHVGGWRKLNMLLPPFDLTAVNIYAENEIFAGKYIGLFSLSG